MKAISLDELRTMMHEDKDFALINVLGRDAFKQQHIPMSVNIPGDQGDFAEQVEAVNGGKERTIVVYCASFDCQASPKAAEKLERAGFKNVLDFEGGTKEWFDKLAAA